MGKKQYDLGKKFEEELCWYLSNNKYYVIYNEKGIEGSQPCDIIAIKNNIATLIECKNLENKTGIFNFNRIEANQFLAYKKFSEKNSNFLLAILWNDNLYLIDFGLIQFYDKSINLNSFKPNLENWSKIIMQKNN